MAKLSELRKTAKEMGISASVIRSATTAEQLQSVIEDHGDHADKRHVAKKKSAVAKKKNARTAPVRKAKGNSARKASTPAKSRKSGKAKRSSKSKAKATSGSSYVPKGGRNVLDSIDWSATDGWNPREGSPVAMIFKSLKKFRGNREKVFEALKSDVWDFVGKKMANGDKRSKDEALRMLRYRIARTAWDFAMRTGQHESADNRVEYGTGGTGRGVWKPARKANAKSSTKPAKATRKPARATKPRKASKSTTAKARAAGRRTKATTRRKAKR